MYKRNFLYKSVFGVISLSTLPLGIDAKEPQNSKQPNIIILFIDDMGYNNFGFRTPSFETPNIDKLVKENVNFQYAYVPSPTSSPSRVGLLTGRHPLKVGFTRHISLNGADPFGNKEYTYRANDPGQRVNRRFLPLGEVTFAEALKKLGYATAHIGKWHLGERDYYPQHQGFDIVHGESSLGMPVSYFPPYFEKVKQRDLDGEYLTDYLTRCASTVITDHNYQDSPLMLYLAHYGVHSPHHAPRERVNYYMQKGMSRTRAIYHAMVEAIDRSVEQVQLALEDAGVADNTLFIFLSDQGSYYTNHPLKGGKLVGSALYEGGARVPFFMKMPGGQANARSITNRVSSLDIFPTLIELAGADAQAYPQLDGKSLLPLIAGEKVKSRTLYFYRSYDDQPASVIDGDIKLIYSRSGRHELYDLSKDEYEIMNLINEKSYKKEARKLLKKMETFLSRYESRPVPFKI